MSENDEQVEQRERSLITPALTSSLADAKLTDADQAARSLALRYAELLDDAVAADKYTKALRLIGDVVQAYADEHQGYGTQTQTEQVLTAWDRISGALAEHSVASDLGPKLQALLTAMGMTPAGRAVKAAPGGQQGDGGGGKVEPMPSTLSLLRGGAAARRGQVG